jgi:6-phosphofructokinase 1
MTIELLDRARQAASSARKIAVVEVLGAHAGWLALQAGIAACADAVLIPEVPCSLDAVAAHLRQRMMSGRPYGVVVVAEGFRLLDASRAGTETQAVNPLKASLAPLATGMGSSGHVIRRSGQAAAEVASGLQLSIAEEAFPLVLGPWTRGGTPTAVDRQLGLAYGAGAVRALRAGEDGVMVAFVPPDIRFVPLAEAINRVRTVPDDSEFIQIALSLGICLGRKES